MATMHIFVPSTIRSITVHAYNSNFPKTYYYTGSYQSVTGLPSSGSAWIDPSVDIVPQSGYGPPYYCTAGSTWNLANDKYISIIEDRYFSISATEAAGTYDLVCAAEQGVNGFYYLKNTTSGTPSYTTRAIESFSSSGGYIYIKDYSTSIPAFSFESGYGHPVWAVNGSGTKLFQITNSDGTFADHKVSTSSSTSSTRYVYLRATEIEKKTLTFHFGAGSWSLKLTNGAEIARTALSSTDTYDYTQDVVISASSVTFHRDYPNFTGTVYWGTSSGSTSYKIGEYVNSTFTTGSGGTTAQRTISYTGNDRDIYITAVGKAHHTIKINPNGGSVSGHTGEYTVSSSWESGTDYTLPSESAGAYSGKKLSGFTLNSTSGLFYSAGSSVTINSTCTFYAVWENNTFWGRIAYMTTKGTVLPQYSTPISRLGKGYKDDTIYGTASAVGYDFAGWTEAQHDPDTYFGTVYKQGDTYSLYCTGESSDSPRNNYLWAYFTKGPTTYYGRLVYKGNGGTFSGGETQIKSGLYSAESILPGAPTKIKISPAQTPTRTGYTFNGWKDSDGNTRVVGQSYDFVLYGTESSPTEFSILAQWTKNTYTLTLNANGGSFGIYGSERTVQAGYGDTIHLSNYKPTRNGYIFKGWNPSSTATSPLYGPDDDYSMTYVNITWYAVWEQSIFTLTLNANSGHFGLLGGETKTITGAYGSIVDLSDSQPTRRKYRHVGWNTSSTATQATYSPTARYTITADATLYAVWSRETIAKFYWDGNTGSTDSTLFKQNAKIKTALTAGRWNLFRAKVKEIAEAVGQTFSYTNVSGNSTLSARDFTSTRNAINNLPYHGTIPSTKSQGDAVGASLYNGTGSLKDGLNAAIDNYNTTD